MAMAIAEKQSSNELPTCTTKPSLYSSENPCTTCRGDGKRCRSPKLDTNQKPSNSTTQPSTMNSLRFLPIFSKGVNIDFIFGCHKNAPSGRNRVSTHLGALIFFGNLHFNKTITTRRFLALPLLDALLAIGSSSPLPITV